jgi:tRNA G18 (ribose-2'-O)-methylase SpoU
MFRTADGAGVTKMFLTGYTPDPVNRFGFPQKEIAKAALGAEASIAWEHPRSVHTLIARLKREGYTIVALEQHATSVHYRKAKVGKKFALIVLSC